MEVSCKQQSPSECKQQLRVGAATARAPFLRHAEEEEIGVEKDLTYLKEVKRVTGQF